MTLLNYTMPAHLPCYDVWEFRIHPGTFLLHVPPLIAVFQGLVADFSRDPKGPRWYKAHIEIEMLPLMRWLEDQSASGAWIIDWDGSQQDLVWYYASSLIYSRQFESFSCPTCEIEYSPLEGSIEEWAFERDSTAARGRRFICPCGHTLYASTESNCIAHVGLNIEQEHVPSFRAALMAVTNPLATGAGEVGEIAFLDTKTFDQKYMAFCDKFAADSRYPPPAQSKMRRRREAIFPYLGQPLLHGGVNHAGFMLNVFVDQASGVVIHWESEPLPQSKRNAEPNAQQLAEVMKAIISTLP